VNCCLDEREASYFIHDSDTFSLVVGTPNMGSCFFFVLVNHVFLI
jgi:hypothetical protein